MARKNAAALDEDNGDDSYANVLSQTWDDLPTAKLLPVGTYVLVGRNVAYIPPKNDKNGKVIFFYVAREPLDDVDPDALAELGDEYDFAMNEPTFTVFIDGPNAWKKVKAHLDLHGVDTSSGTIKEQFKRFKGTEIAGRLDQRSFTARGQEVTENNIVDFAVLED